MVRVAIVIILAAAIYTDVAYGKATPPPGQGVSPDGKMNETLNDMDNYLQGNKSDHRFNDTFFDGNMTYPPHLNRSMLTSYHPRDVSGKMTQNGQTTPKNTGFSGNQGPNGDKNMSGGPTNAPPTGNKNNDGYGGSGMTEQVPKGTDSMDGSGNKGTDGHHGSGVTEPGSSGIDRSDGSGTGTPQSPDNRQGDDTRDGSGDAVPDTTLNPANRQTGDRRDDSGLGGQFTTINPGNGRRTTQKQDQERDGNDLPARVQTDTLTKDQQRKLEEAFGSASTSSFTGGTLFDPESGNLTGEFWDSLDSDEQKAMGDMQRMGKDAFNLEAIFNNSLPDDVVFFTQEFGNMDQAVFQKFYDTPSLLTPDDLKEVSLSVMSAINETTLRSKLETVPGNTKEKICKMLQNGETDYDSTKRIVKGIDCSSVLASRNMVPCGSLAEAIAENKMEEQSPESWTTGKQTDAITSGWLSGLPKEVIETFPGNLLRQNMDKVRKIKHCLDKEVQEKIFSKIKSDVGGFSNMGKEDLEMMGDMVGQMSYREMKNLDPSAIKESLSTFKDAGMNRLQKMHIKKSVKETGSAADWTADDIVNSAALFGTDKNLIDQLDVNKVVQNLTALGEQDFDRRSSRAMAKKLRESSDYDEASDFDTAKFKQMKKLASGFSPRFIEDMTDNVDFKDVLNDGSLRDVDFPKDSARALVEGIKTDLGGNLHQAHLENLDKAVVGLRKTEVDNVDGDDLANALENMKDTMSEVMTEMDDTTLAAMVEKVETATGGLGANLEKMGPLLQKVPVKKLQNLTDSEFGDMSGKTERNFNCSTDTCPELYKRVTNTIGTPSLKNPNFTLSAFKNLKNVMCGMPLDDLQNFPATSVLEDVAGYLLELKCLSDKQERVIAEKIKYRLGLYGDSVTSIRRQDVKKYGGIMKHFTVNELNQLGRCSDITLELGAQDLSNVKKEDLKNLASYALECVNKTEGSLTSDDVTTAGDLLCGLDTDRIKDIDSDAMTDVIFNVQSKCAQLGTKEREEWAKKSMEKLNITSENIGNVTDVELTQIGTFTGELGRDKIDRISDDVMSSVSPDLVDQFTELEDNLDAREEEGFGGDISNKDKEASDTKKKQVYTKMIEASIQTSTGSRRRKRSTSTLTCDDMQLLGSGVTAMTSSQIEAMSDSDFIDCAQTLGGYSTWDSSQLLSLLTVATRSGTYGDSSVWTSDHVYNVGIIAQGLTSTELLALSQLTIDSMYSIGRHSGWSETQLSAGFERWLALNKNSNASGITSTELISLGHFACGASTTHIDQVDSTIYSYAASYIGALTSCQESQLVSWANHAKTAFGGITTWDTSVITTVGTVIGGLTSTEIGTLTTTQVAAIEPASIAEIPAATFVGFTVDQLSSFSTAQALSTTASQQAGLSDAQLSALESAGATIYGAASAIQVSCVSMVLAVMMALLFKKI